MENPNKNEHKSEVLALKHIGEIARKMKFHLDAALDEYHHLERKCQQIEKERGIKMQFNI